MHYHPLIRGNDLSLADVWYERDEIVGVVHPEHETGTVYFEMAPGRHDLVEEMLIYAEDRLGAAVGEGTDRKLGVYISDDDDQFQRLATDVGFVKTGRIEPLLPEGFRFRSLADENDLSKLDRVLFRGFNHGEEPPPDGIDDRKLIRSPMLNR